MEFTKINETTAFGTGQDGVPSTASFAQLLASSPLVSGVQRRGVGVVSEVMPEETRVALTPSAVREMVASGQVVYVQSEAGSMAGFSDEMYTKAGAIILPTARQVYERAQIVAKVQPLTISEAQMVQPMQILFCFMSASPYVLSGASKNGTFNSSSIPSGVFSPLDSREGVSECDYYQQQQFQQQQYQQQYHQYYCQYYCHQEQQAVRALLAQRQATVLFYEWMQTQDNSAPVMNALSEVAGDMAVQQGMRIMMTDARYGGKGELLGQVAGEEGARVLILGSGVAATRAAKMAAAIGARVTVMDVNTEKLRQLTEQMSSVLPIQTLAYSAENLAKVLPETQLLIGAVIPTCRPAEEQTGLNNAGVHATLSQQYSWTGRPLVSATQLSLLKKGAVVVDLAAAYGGNFEVTGTRFSPVFGSSTDTEVFMAQPQEAQATINAVARLLMQQQPIMTMEVATAVAKKVVMAAVQEIKTQQSGAVTPAVMMQRLVQMLQQQIPQAMTQPWTLEIVAAMVMAMSMHGSSYSLYAPANITAAVPSTASKAIANAVMPLVHKVAKSGWKAAAAEENAIRKGLMMAEGQLIRSPRTYIPSRAVVPSTYAMNAYYKATSGGVFNPVAAIIGGTFGGSMMNGTMMNGTMMDNRMMDNRMMNNAMMNNAMMNNAMMNNAMMNNAMMNGTMMNSPMMNKAYTGPQDMAAMHMQKDAYSKMFNTPMMAFEGQTTATKAYEQDAAIKQLLAACQTQGTNRFHVEA